MNAKLEEKIDNIKNLSIEELCEKFECKPSEICMGDYIAKHTTDKVCPYKVILGFANFEYSDVESLGKLEYVYGKKLGDRNGKVQDSKHQAIYLGITIKNSKITSLGKLRKVYGSLTVNKLTTTLGQLEFLGSNLYLNNTNVEDLGNLTHIDGILNIEDDAVVCKLESLGNLKKVRRLYISSNCLVDFGALEETLEIKIGPRCKKKVKEWIENSFEKVGNKYIRKDLLVDQD